MPFPPVEKVLAVQAVQTPALKLKPAEQVLHTPEVVTQSVQPLHVAHGSDPAEKVPFAQATQLVPKGSFPGLQLVQIPLVETQLTQLVHGSHAVALLVVLNVLAAQGLQPPGAVALMNCPGAHWLRVPWTSRAAMMVQTKKLKLFINLVISTT